MHLVSEAASVPPQGPLRRARAPSLCASYLTSLPDLSIKKVERSTPMYFLPYIDFSDPNAIGLGGHFLLVRKQAQREPVFGFELLVARRAIGRNSDDFGAGVCEFFGQAGEILRLLRATRRVVLRIEINDDRTAFQLGESGRLAPVVVG